MKYIVDEAEMKAIEEQMNRKIRELNDKIAHLSSLAFDVNAKMEALHKENEEIWIERVVFNDPATIILWSDGTKTVVKCSNKAFDPEKGLAMAIVKKVLGNTGSYYNLFRDFLPEKKAEPEKIEENAEWQKLVDEINSYESTIDRLKRIVLTAFGGKDA